MAEAEAVFVPAASLWEITIKAGLGRIQVDPERLRLAILPCGFQELPITLDHACGVKRLAAHHRDPFDRILVAQACLEPLRLVTTDATLPLYSDLVIRV
jgi:PIN domain nuclease of toxin-antitoxin system